MLERVNVTLDEQKIGTALHRQEPTARDVDTVTYILSFICDYDGDGEGHTFEMFNRCSSSRL